MISGSGKITTTGKKKKEKEKEKYLDFAADPVHLVVWRHARVKVEGRAKVGDGGMPDVATAEPLQRHKKLDLLHGFKVVFVLVLSTRCNI